jgi:hypothetical protein
MNSRTVTATLARWPLTLLATLLVALAFQSTAHADVTVVSSGSITNAAATTVMITNITAPNNGLVVVGASMNSGNGSSQRFISTVTWNGNSLTCVGAKNGDGTGACLTQTNGAGIRTEIWSFKVGAAQGATGSVIVTATGSASITAGAVAFAGVTASPVGTFVGASGTLTPATVTASANPGVGGFVFDALATSGTSATAAGGQTQEWNAGASPRGAGSIKSGAASGTISTSWTLTSNPWAIGSVPISAAPPIRRGQTIIGSKSDSPVRHCGFGDSAAAKLVHSRCDVAVRRVANHDEGL